MRTNQVLKSALKSFIPQAVHNSLRSALCRSEYVTARKRFESAPATPVWLGRDELESLQQQYPHPREYGYDPDTLERRGRERAEHILSLIHAEADSPKTFLELGCFDGMVSCALQREGKIATAVDIRPNGFDERAVRAGVSCLQMDAHGLQFKDESFDFVFSYDAFEHFARPGDVLHEVMRVVKTGGYVYLLFGPLYMSPMGLHAYRSVTVPYCQFLFPEDLLKEFVADNGLAPIDFQQVNRWTVNQYRKLWQGCSDTLEPIFYQETTDPAHLGLVIKHPSCFKSKTACFDDLIVSGIEALFRKVGANADRETM